MPAKTITNPSGAYGVTDFQSQLGNVTCVFVTSAAVTAPACVSIGTDGKVAMSATAGTASLAIGIAIESGGIGDAISVVVLGMAENVGATGAIAAGGLVKRSTATIGFVEAAGTPATGEIVGIAINAAAGNTVDVWVNAAKVAS